MRYSAIHGRMEQAFAAWGRGIVRYRWPALVLALVVTGGLASFLPPRVDNSTESFLHPDDPMRIAYDAFRDQFGRDSRLIIAIRPPEIFDLEFLEKLRRFHREIEADAPYVQEVTSLVNARNTRGEDDLLVVEDLLADWPESEADLAALRQRVGQNPLYENTLVDDDFDLTTLSVRPFTYSTKGAPVDAMAGFADDAGNGAGDGQPEYLTEEEQLELVEAVSDIADRYEGPDFEVYMIGGGIENKHFNEALAKDMSVFMAGSIGTIIVLLGIVFRRVSSVLLTLAVVIPTLLATMGTMALLDIPSSVTGQVLPILLLSVGTCNAVHILAIFYADRRRGRGRHDAIESALTHSGVPVLLTNLTTAGGLMAFVVAELAPVADLGVIAPIGIMLAYFYTVLLLPSLLAIFPIPAGHRPVGGAQPALAARVLARIGGVSTGRPRAVLAVSAGIVLVGALGLRDLRFGQDWLIWFPESSPVPEATELIDREFQGAQTVEVVIDTRRKNGLKDPEMLNRIDRAMRFAESFERGPVFVGKATSITDVVKEIHKALNENRQEYYEIPQNRELVAQELLLFENSGTDDLEEIVDTQFRKARLTLRVPYFDSILYEDFLRDLEPGLREILGDDVGIQITGLAPYYARTLAAVVISLARSYGFALAVITPLMIFLVGSLRTGLLAMIPNLIPVLLALGLMGWLDMPLDSSSLLMGCIIISLAVDDTIHFMHKFQRYFEATGSVAESVHRTLVTTGTALLFTTIVLACGFFVMTFASLSNLVAFGVLLSFSVAVAFLADVFVAPALLTLTTRPRAA